MKSLLAILLLAATVARGEWVEVQPIRNTGLPGVLGEIEDRMPGATKWTGNSDPILWAHEATHLLNSQVSDGPSNLYFVPIDGFAFRIVKPDHWVSTVIDGQQAREHRWPISASEVARSVSSAFRGQPWAFYLGNFSQQNYPEGFVDELSAHVCGIEAGRQANRDVWSDVEGARHHMHYSLMLAHLTRQRGYPETAAEIEEFCRWCLAYLQDNGYVMR